MEAHLPLPEHCQEHGENIATILQQTTQIEAHLRTLNGRVGRAEDQIVALSVKQSAHDVIQTTIMQKLIPLEDSMGKMKDWKAGVIGGAASTGKLIREWITVIALAAALWQGWTSHQALQASQQAQTHQK